MGATDEQTSRTRRAEQSVSGGAVRAVRLRLAQVVWLAAVVCALLRAVGGLQVALDANPDNALGKLVLDGADALDLGVFDPDKGVFTFDGADADTKNALVNWGLAAVAYLIVGRVLERIARP